MSICFTYRNAEELRKAIKDGKFGTDGAVITVSAANVKMLYACVPEDKKSYFNCCSVKDFIYHLLPKWCSKRSEEKLKQFLEYGNILRMCKMIFSDNEFRSFQRNAAQVIESMRFLQELDISYKDICPADRQENLLKTLCAVFSKQATAKYLQEKKNDWLNKGNFLRDIATISAKLNNVFDKEYFKFSPDAFFKPKVYFHGFLTFSPLENLLIQCFERAGVEVCYVNYWDDRVKAAFDILKYNPRLEAVEKIPFYDNAKKKGKFCYIYDNKLKPLQMDFLPKIYKFNDIFSLVSTMDNAKEDISLLCPSGVDMDKFQQTFFGEGNRNKLAAYPIGQYLYCLYDMWDSSNEKLNITADKIRQCISTGYANADGFSAGELMAVFQQAGSIFADCSSIRDWYYTMMTWDHNYHDVVPDIENGSNEKNNFSRWDSIMGNIWRNAGPFAMDEAAMNALIRTIGNILTDVHLLLDDTAVINTENHITKLSELISSKYSIVSQYEVQRELIMNFFDDVINNLSFVESSHTSELCSAMKMILSGGINADQEEIMEGIYLGEIESYLLRMNHSSKYLVAFCDARHLPAAKSALSWPLSEEFILNAAGGNKDAIRDYLYGYNSHQMEGRYLFYLALQLPNVEFSWVVNMEEKTQIMSPYLALLNSQGSEIIPSAGSLLRSEENNSQNFGYIVGKYVPMDSLGIIPSEVAANDLYCPFRNIYDYVFSKYPSFNSKFQLQFFATAAIKVIYDSVGYIAPNRKARNMTNISKEVFTNLPLWNVTERLYILDFARKYGLLYKMKNYETGDFDILKPINDTAGANVYKSDRLFAKYINRYMTQKIIKTMQQTKNLESIPPIGNCIYCPHNECCCFQEKKKRM